MNKAQITKVGLFWRLLYYRPTANIGLQAITEDYLFFIGAQRRFLEIESKTVREQSAFAKLQVIRRDILSIKEDEFIQKLYPRACRNITKRQYGYLSGIYERQIQ